MDESNRGRLAGLLCALFLCMGVSVLVRPIGALPREPSPRARAKHQLNMLFNAFLNETTLNPQADQSPTYRWPTSQAAVVDIANAVNAAEDELAFDIAFIKPASTHIASIVLAVPYQTTEANSRRYQCMTTDGTVQDLSEREFEAQFGDYAHLTIQRLICEGRAATTDADESSTPTATAR